MTDGSHEFDEVDLTGARLRRVLLVDADLRQVRLTGARFRMVDFGGAVMRDVSLADVSIDGVDLTGLVINGVEIAPLVNAELLRREPARALLRAGEPADLREAWRLLERSWATTYDRVAAMPPGSVDVSVGGEWSFAQTLRHLVFATDGWLGAARNDKHPHHRWGVPFSEVDEFVDGGAAGLGIDAQAAPSYAEVLDLRADRVSQVREFLATITADQLAAQCGRPPWADGPHTVLDCVRVILDEEVEHHRFAVRDLDSIAADH